MKTLIAIPSCARDRETQHAQRQLLKGVDYRFFLGVGNAHPMQDEVILPVRDDYMALPEKVRQAFRWRLSMTMTMFSSAIATPTFTPIACWRPCRSDRTSSDWSATKATAAAAARATGFRGSR